LKASNVLGVALLITEIVSIGLFLVCGQTIFSIIGSVAPGSGQIPVVEDQATQTASLTFTFSPRNNGLLAVDLDLGFGLTLSDGSYTLKNTTTVSLNPGAGRDVSLSIRVPIAVLQDYSNVGGTVDIYTSIGTLNGLVHLDYSSRSEGVG
jgi:hypothetical protein